MMKMQAEKDSGSHGSFVWLTDNELDKLKGLLNAINICSCGKAQPIEICVAKYGFAHSGHGGSK